MTIEEALARLASAGIDLLPLAGLETHFAFHRGGFVALVERTAGGFGSIGSTGLLTDHGFAALVWRPSGPAFVAKGFEKPASKDEVARLRSFSDALADALLH
ncbi:MAG: hypothetical protein ACM336_04615 [Acidobacteriota bacterium]